MRPKAVTTGLLYSAIFEGKGDHVTLKNVANNDEYLSFGPFDSEAVLEVTIVHRRGAIYIPSKMVGPLTVSREAFISRMVAHIV